MAVSYPLEIDENPDFYRSMVEFKVYDTEPAQLTTLDAKPSMQSGSGSSSSFSVSSIFESLFGETATQLSQGKFDLPTSSSGTVLSNEVITPASGFEDIKIYMPVSFSQTDTFSYQNTELGAAGAIGLAAARGGANIAGAAGAAIEEGMAGITDTLDALLGSGQLGQVGTARLASKLGGASQAALEQAGQVVSNPNIRASFKSVGLRKFQFLFNFIPKNTAEADAVDGIIYNFRKAAYPEDISTGNGAVSLAYKYPQLFRIIPKVRTDRGFEVAVGTPLKLCYLESITVNNNPIGNNTFHADGHAIQTDLSLSFVEYKTLSRSDIRHGYREPEGDGT